MKKGSALLIVLGMMSFMVVSAVAFSMFMRQSRLPSSFLRQRIAASQLVKAALANAMREIDIAVGDNPYPGVGNASNRNYWKSRVYMGDNTAYNQGTDEEPPYETVSTLTLEALAYLPPPLVDSVRYWSRRTKTAAWSSLGYDAGRYAYTAVNVSDYFDINRLRANVMRDSSPSNRIALAYLFENADHTGNGTVSPGDFDTAVEQVRQDGYATRLVSMADYNLSLKYGALQGTKFTSPFCEYIVSPPKDGTFYGGTVNLAKMQKFVTDSWYPGSLTNTTALALTDAAAQPLEGLGRGIDPLLKNGNAGFNAITKHLNLPETAALADYIDEDNVPTSLALPTMERVPSLTGLQIVPINFKPAFVHEDIEGEPIPATDTEPASKWMYRLWSLKSLGDARLLVGGSAVFPFKRTSGLSEKTSFDAQVLVKMVIAPSTETGFDSTRPSVSYRPNKSDWSTIPSDVNQAFWAFSKKGTVTVKHGLTEKDAVAATLTIPEIDLSLGSAFPNQVFGIKYKESDPTTFTVDATKIDKPMKYRTAGGEVKLVKDLVGANGSSADLQVHFFVWVRILDGSDTVDLVPATIADDQLYNGLPLPGVSTDLLGESQKVPVLPFDGPTLGISLGKTFFTPEKESFVTTPADVKGLRIYCNDPRFNWAPEDWFLAGDDAQISGDGWLAEVLKANNAPNDIFQFVSNEGYLQSMGEIQFLPMVRSGYNDFSEDDPISGQFVQGGSTRYNVAKFAAGINSVVNRSFMWRTRCLYGDEGRQARNARQDPYDWGVVDTRGGTTVSPYADKDLMMAAFANTPYDWIVASENDKMTLDAGRKYCFGPSSSEAKISWTDLETIVANIKAAIGSNVNWQGFFRDACKSDSDEFFGVDLGDDFHDVDRKFLYSYWKNCLGNDQQLFLVFVRAEPTVMGGSSAKQTPSQLGARAVALVWREPVSSVPDQQQGGASVAHPHRMRILFYHQFE